MVDIQEGTGPLFRHKEVKVKGIPMHVVEAGLESNPTVFFIHGWPTCWLEFESVMKWLVKDFHVVAIDLPGIGGSKIPLQSYSKRHIAMYVRGVMDTMALTDVTLVGCDVGGQVTYAFLKEFPNRIARAVIMNVVIPGIPPWDTVKRNPYIWHFAFHAIPQLPEKLVAGNELLYFSYFYDVLAGKGKKLGETLKKSFTEAYTRPGALKAGFDFYRSFDQDQKDNAATKEKSISIPILYLRGENEQVDIATYMDGFKEFGLRHIKAKLIENCGHFSAEENPEKVAYALKLFIKGDQN
ncbi:pimeloyl-ACP methyl ester carboxylesterase [Pullulanibacillus pueri]|uniref:Alpha/beta hydrolase n=1 Tax=Pullulanibacillus pueri TaxID=1437324 RepID=A0A8J2ZUU1_9BACL|nr:alpha/beta hydrolase [Pullulanibacillus pueri]MBM7681209.1 pimeloyl-ACP methyl ester carboxylesterase [Pullulanibacillus pueri]GGH78031.1 alpha/beta hydrolase [Pullulanibacillus pueri]